MTTPSHIIDIDDVSPTELREILSVARAVRDAGRSPSMAGRTLGLLFEQPSTRTRVSFEAGMTTLGGHAVVMTPDQLQLGNGEPIGDTARALSSYLDVIAARVADHQRLLELAEHATVPVINALTDRAHPCQAMADLLTIEDRFGGTDGVSVTFVGDGNNVAGSLAVGAAMTGVDLTVATPPEYGLTEDVVERASRFGATPTRTHDPVAAVADADVVYTDVWVSMSDGVPRDEKLADFDGFVVDEALLAAAPSHAVFMHCLPAHRGEEVTAAVLEGDRSIVWRQAANRMYAQQGLLLHLIDGTDGTDDTGCVGSYQGSLQTVDWPATGAD